MRVTHGRRRLVAGSAALLGGLMLGTVAFAADEPPAQQAQQTPVAEAEAPAATERTNTPTHTVVHGDTLWDIAAARLGRPLRWKEIWKLNTYIKNPDLIYPGQVLELDELTSGMPPAAREAPAESALEEEEGIDLEERLREIDRQAAEITATFDPEEAAKPPAFLETLRPAPPPVPPMVVATSGAIITNQPTRGQIVSGTLHQLLIGSGNRVFLKPEKGTDLKDGETLMVGRAVRKVRHPKTGARMGQLVQVMGEVSVREHQRGLILGEVTKAVEPLQAGDFLLAPSAAPAPATEEAAPAGSQGGIQDIRGYIVESKQGNRELGQLDIVYIDKGRRDGVRVDDLYVVLRPGRDRGFFRPATPDTHLGELRIIAVQDATATAEITKSLEPITFGDTIDGPVVSAALPVPTGP